jgi:glycosyltransferase involved in cell wall biosynthesis
MSKPPFKVLMCAIHPKYNGEGYIGGGWSRLIELLRRAPQHNIEFVLVESRPFFKDFHDLKYEAVSVPDLSRNFLGELFTYVLAIVYGLCRLKKGDINLILSPIEQPGCNIVAFILSKFSKVPWTGELHLVPMYGLLLDKGKPKTSSLKDLFQECRKTGFKLFDSLFYGLITWLEFRFMEKAKFMLAPSKGISEDMLIVNPKIRVRIFYPGNGVNLEIINSVPHGPKHYDGIYVGALSSRKGIFDALEIWSLVASQREGFRLAVIGRGREEAIDKIKKLVKDKKLEANVEFLFDPHAGAPTLENVWFYMKRSKVLIHPSIIDGWPLVIGEALGCGIPVVTYDLPPQRYSFGTCPIVFRIPHRDLKAFASEILSILKSYSEKKYNAVAKTFVSKYTWDDVLAAEKQAYMELVEEKLMKARCNR